MAARGLEKLSPDMIATAKPGRHADGGGLYLVVEKSGSRHWVFRCVFRGKETWLGLGSATPGSLKVVDLQEARRKAQIARDALKANTDPREALKPPTTAPTFKEAAEAFVDVHEVTWRNPKHRYQWRQTLKAYVYPHFGGVPVDEVTTDHVLRALRPIWAAKPETAQRTRGRIERILDAERAAGHIPAAWQNPARWSGLLEFLLPDPSKFPRGKHPALPYQEMPGFMADLRQRDAMAAAALEWTILTAARTGETINAIWSEIDLSAKVWTVPAERMKTGRPHRVPLSETAVSLLERVWPVALGKPAPTAMIFPGPSGRPLSNMAMRALLDRMGRENISVHGMRSTFRDWVGDETEYARELAEAALAHLVGDEVERAYRRGDALERRRELMQAWAEFCGTQPSSSSQQAAEDRQLDAAPADAASNVILFRPRQRA